MMDERTLRRLTHSLESAAALALARPARVLWLQDGESADEVRAQYFQENSSALGRLELLVISPPAPAPQPAEAAVTNITAAPPPWPISYFNVDREFDQ
jgi:hypothetical protein